MVLFIVNIYINKKKSANQDHAHNDFLKPGPKMTILASICFV